MTDHDPVTGEVLPAEAPVPGTLRRMTEDGPAPKNGRDAAGIIAMLEGGDWNFEMGEDIRELVQAMEAYAHNNKGTAKGEVTIKLNLSLANGIFVLVGGHTVKKPVAKRLGTPLFAREDGALGVNPSGQYRSLGHQATMREVEIEQPVREVGDRPPAREV